MIWTPAPPPYSTWTATPPPDNAWTPANQPVDAWDTETSGLHRIIEAGNHRVTEDGRAIRIVERRDIAWTLETANQSLWSTE